MKVPMSCRRRTVALAVLKHLFLTSHVAHAKDGYPFWTIRVNGVGVETQGVPIVGAGYKAPYRRIGGWRTGPGPQQ